MEIKFNYIKSNIDFDTYCNRVNQIKERFGPYAQKLVDEYCKSILTLNDNDWNLALIAMGNAHDSYTEGWRRLWSE